MIKLNRFPINLYFNYNFQAVLSFNERFNVFLTLEFTHIFIFFIENANVFSEDLFSIAQSFLTMSQKIS